MNVFLRLIRYSWSLRKYYIAISFFVIVVSLLNQATPFLLKDMIDTIFPKGERTKDLSRLWIPLVLVLVVNVAITFISNVQGYLGDMLASKLNTLMSQRYYEHLLKLPLAYFDNEIAGRITSRLERGINTTTQLANAMANNFIGFYLTSLITIGILAYYSLPVAIALALLFPFYAYFTRRSSVHWQAAQMGINTDTDINNGRFVESINQIRVVKSFTREIAEHAFFLGKRHKIEHETRGQSIQWHRYDVYRRLGLNIVFFIIYAFVVIGTYNGDYTIGELTLMLQLVTQAQFPLFGLSFIVDQLQRAKAGTKEFFEVMDTEPAIADSPDAMALEVKHGRIEFDNVRFSYVQGNEVMRGLSFTIEPGTRVALVGESGEGKTTIANLLLRFYSVDSGRIRIDDTCIGDVTQESLHRNIGVVFQEPALFSGTIRENIMYGKPDASEEELHRAADIANAARFIETFPDGYDTEIGERGVRLSGGQKQRIAIARAVLKDPPVLIFDEATSSLDSKAEAEVQQALDRLMEGRSTLVIAHRLSTIARVDKIIGLMGGRVVEEGAPAELAQTGGMYATLLSLQDPTVDNEEILRRYGLYESHEEEWSHARSFD